MQRIVVGVDGSPPSVEALRRAADEARWRDATLEIVYVFTPPEPIAPFPVMVEKGGDKTDVEAARKQAQDRLDAWYSELDIDFDGIKVTRTVLADRRPARALVERSAHADLVVVGSRGRGGFAGLRLGSVSEQVTRHAHCPVLVVRQRGEG